MNPVSSSYRLAFEFTPGPRHAPNGYPSSWLSCLAFNAWKYAFPGARRSLRRTIPRFPSPKAWQRKEAEAEVHLHPITRNEEPRPTPHFDFVI